MVGTEPMPSRVLGSTELGGDKLKICNGFLKPNFELGPNLSPFYLRPRSAVDKTGPNPLGMSFQYGKIFHLAGMQLELQTLEPWHDMKVHVKYRLPRRRPVQLGDHDARRLESLLDGVSDSLHGLDGAAQNDGIHIMQAFGTVLGNHQGMTRHLGHDVHEGQRLVGLTNLERGGLAAQNFRKDIIAIVTH